MCETRTARTVEFVDVCLKNFFFFSAGRLCGFESNSVRARLLQSCIYRITFKYIN